VGTPARSDGDDRRLEVTELQLDAFDVAVNAEDRVDTVGEQGGQEVVADRDDLDVVAGEADALQGAVEGGVVGGDAGDPDRVALQVAQRADLGLLTARTCVTRRRRRLLEGVLMLARAQEIIASARGHAEKLGVVVSVAVVDSGGHLVALERMDGAGFATPEIAWGKAWTAAAFASSSSEVADRFNSAPAFSASVAAATHGRFTPRQGALPLEGGGAVGASGATSDQDEEIVRKGVRPT
jgi:uncharacterized protein GlcG (DUF336 family)